MNRQQRRQAEREAARASRHPAPVPVEQRDPFGAWLASMPAPECPEHGPMVLDVEGGEEGHHFCGCRSESGSWYCEAGDERTDEFVCDAVAWAGRLTYRSPHCSLPDVEHEGVQAVTVDAP